MRRNFGNRMAKPLVWVMLMLMGSLAQAQYVRWDNTATTTTGMGQMLPVLALPGASISFYTGCTALPCATPAVTYQSASGASCPSNAQVVWQAAVGTGCHATADSEGNFGGWFAPGDYQYTITINSTTAGPYDFAVGSGGGTPVMNLQHNSSSTGILQSLYNLCDNGSCGPALDAGMQQVVAKTGTNDGSWVLETVAQQASQQMQITYQPPIAGQYIVMYPLTCSTNSSSAAAGSCSTLSNAGSLTVNRWSSGSTVTPTDVYAISTGWAYDGVAGLPSFVSAANVTAVYGVEWAYSTSTYGNLSNFIAGIAMGTPGHGGIGWTPYSAKVDGGSPTTFNFATTTATLHNNASGNSGPVNDLTTVYPALIVYYTGSAPPATSTVPVNPPFTFSASGLGLQWPFNYSGDTGASGSAYAISLPFLLKNVNGSVFNNISSGADVWFTPAHTNTVTNPTLNLNGYYPGTGTILGRGSGAIAVGDIVAGIDAHVEWGSDGKWHLQNPQTGSGGGAVTSVSNSDGSLNFSPTTGAVVGSINYAHAGTWTALETFNAGISSSALTLSAITGSTQCLHVNTSGVVSGTGADCGAGGGGAFSGGLGTSYQDVTETTAPANPAAGNDRLYTDSTTHLLSCLTSSGTSCMPVGGGGVGPGTTGTIPFFNTTTTVADSHLDDGKTTAGTITSTEPVNVAATGPSQAAFTYNATPLVPGSSTTAVYGVDSGGKAVVSESGGSASEVCTGANGVCAGTGGALVNITNSLTATGCTISGGVCTVGTTTATITLSGIPTTYKDLSITVTGSNSTTGFHAVTLDFNADTGSNYYFYGMCASGGSCGTTNGSAVTSGDGCILGATGTNGGGNILINGYASSRPKTWTGLCQGFAASAATAYLWGGYWTGTSAITSITFGLTVGNFEVGDTVIVRGVN